MNILFLSEKSCHNRILKNQNKALFKLSTTEWAVDMSGKDGGKEIRTLIEVNV